MDIVGNYILLYRVGAKIRTSCHHPFPPDALSVIFFRISRKSFFPSDINSLISESVHTRVFFLSLNAVKSPGSAFVLIQYSKSLGLFLINNSAFIANGSDALYFSYETSNPKGLSSSPSPHLLIYSLNFSSNP